jgi:hypothetical protein
MSVDDAETLAHYRLTQQGHALAEKIDRRAREVIGLKGFARELHWLEDAAALLGERLLALRDPLHAAQRLPELQDEREAFARVPQLAWVDALERLWAGISFNLGRRAPLLEALFPHQKFAALRRPRPDLVRAYAADFSKRQQKSYVQRILAADDGAFARPVIDEVQARLAAYEDVLAAPPLEGEAAEDAREAVRAAARKLEPALRQARYLLDAANLTLPEPEPEPESDDADDEEP